MDNKSNSLDMTQGPLIKNIFIFSLPLMATSFLQILFNSADTIVVGKFAGEDALAAVGATGSIVFFLTSLFIGLSSGANIVIAQYIGAKDNEKTHLAVHSAMFLGLASGIILVIVGLFISTAFLRLLSTPENIIDLSALYLKIYFCGSIFLLIYDFGTAILRANGDTKRPLHFLVISGLMNVVLNLFFVIVLKMSVSGVAIATVISEGVAAILVVKILIEEKGSIHLNLKDLKLEKGTTLKILHIGVPSGIRATVFAISNMAIQSSINSFDSSAIVAGNTAAQNLENFVYIGMSAFTQAAGTFTGQNVGAGNKEQVGRILRLTLILTTVASVVISFIIWSNGDFFLRLYTNEQEVIDVGMIRLTYVVLLLAFQGILDSFVSSLSGMGYSTIPTIVTLVGICVTRLIWLTTVFPMHRSIKTIYICFPLSWILTSIVEAIMWLHCYRKFKGK